MGDNDRRVIDLDADPVNRESLWWARREKAAPSVLLGQALGDAFGAPVEFESPLRIAAQRERLSTFPGGGSFDWSPGEFTDDTQMAVVLARHLVAHEGVDQPSLAADFAEWAAHPDTLDVGIQTRTVLSAVSRGSSWEQAVEVLKPEAEGNGGLMRVAPAILASGSRDDARDLAAAQSMVTHPNRQGVDACRVFASILWDSLTHGELTLTPAHAEEAQEPEVRDAVLAAFADEPPEMSGYVIHTLTGALWAVRGARNFEDAVWRATSLGRDADTVAAVAGSLAGAVWGEDGISAAWRARVSSAHPMFAPCGEEDLTALAQNLVRVGMARRRRLEGTSEGAG